MNNDFNAFIESLLGGLASDECPDPKCSVHYRVDGVAPGRTPLSMIHITYVGEHAILTDVQDRRDLTEGDILEILVTSRTLRDAGDLEGARALIESGIEGFTAVYNVGKSGVLSAVKPGTKPVEEFYGTPQDNEIRHSMTVDLYSLKVPEGM